ncbi:hypothetical protein MP228_011204 [Amoeboaphelidium protococcarum]|nr:hypothetical protein MP228_011204 [Amoeboaphelidium protococcarum]
MNSLRQIQLIDSPKQQKVLPLSFSDIQATPARMEHLCKYSSAASRKDNNHLHLPHADEQQNSYHDDSGCDVMSSQSLTPAPYLQANYTDAESDESDGVMDHRISSQQCDESPTQKLLMNDQSNNAFQVDSELNDEADRHLSPVNIGFAVAHSPPRHSAGAFDHTAARNDSMLQGKQDEIPTPATFNDLVMMIRNEMKQFGLMDMDDADISRLQAIMSKFDASMVNVINDCDTAQDDNINKEHHYNDWRQYAFYDPYRYTRNLVDDGNGKYNLLLLCWGPRQVSPVHDHSGSHCLLKVMSGELQETRYDWPQGRVMPPAGLQKSMSQSLLCGDIDSNGCNGNGGEDDSESSLCASSLNVKSQFTMKTNQVAYMHDKLGLHRVSNPNEDQPAVSLHLYSPPIEICRTFCAETGKARTGGRCVFYSVKGKKLTCGNK